MTKLKLSAFLLLLVPVFVFAQKKEKGFFEIPATEVQVNKSSTEGEGLKSKPDDGSLLVSFSRPKMVQLKDFEISRQVSLGEYKRFLEAMRRDSGEAYAQKLLPDSSIAEPAKYRLYLNDPVYEAYPVVGVSWENAFRYCLWRSLSELERQECFYRLPTQAEWLAANQYLAEKNSSDFNKDYADWLVNAYYENAYSFIHDLNPDVSKDGTENESAANKRKRYIGNSYKISFRDPSSFNGLYQYKTSGHPFLGFRCVRECIGEISSDAILAFFKKQFNVKL